MSKPRPICPWSFLDVSEMVPPKSYAATMTMSIIPIASLPLPVIHDGRTTITISKEGYQYGPKNANTCSSGVSIYRPKINLILPLNCVRNMGRDWPWESYTHG
ncbi:hypothetical protein M0R45_020978 [Rubus argutus]|uniref:Uncharacterized protein n=1 Tax=Rubus argutus TaxID=59490 RepID=A0AAW1X9Y6_RUBAR